MVCFLWAVRELAPILKCLKEASVDCTLELQPQKLKSPVICLFPSNSRPTYARRLITLMSGMSRGKDANRVGIVQWREREREQERRGELCMSYVQLARQMSGRQLNGSTHCYSRWSRARGTTRSININIATHTCIRSLTSWECSAVV